MGASSTVFADGDSRLTREGELYYWWCGDKKTPVDVKVVDNDRSISGIFICESVNLTYVAGYDSASGGVRRYLKMLRIMDCIPADTQIKFVGFGGICADLPSVLTYHIRYDSGAAIMQKTYHIASNPGNLYECEPTKKCIIEYNVGR